MVFRDLASNPILRLDTEAQPKPLESVASKLYGAIQRGKESSWAVK
jgi:hypothetical protein